MAGQATRTGDASNTDWTVGPAKWGGAGFLGGASLVGLIWVLGAREPSPMLDRSHAAIVIPSDELDAPPSAVALLPEPAQAKATQIAPPKPEPESAKAQTPRIVLDEEPSPAPAPPDDELPPESPLESRLVDLEPSPAPAPADDEAESAQEPALAVRIRVNSASPSELELLPGVGPVIASRISESRASDGPFKDLRDLQRVRGIGPKTAQKLAPHIRFD